MATQPAQPAQGDLGLKLIVLFKLAKAIGQLSLFVALAWAFATGGLEALVTLVERYMGLGAAGWLRQNVSLSDSQALLLALGVDGTSTLLEGVGLYLGKRWAAYLVVVATSAYIPLQLWSMANGGAAWRVLPIALNLLIVGYLIKRVLLAAPASPSSVGGEPTPAGLGTDA